MPMERIREIVAYKNYLEDFLTRQPVKVQDKIFRIEIEKAVSLMNEYYGNKKR
jgi:hypothetical protein